MGLLQPHVSLRTQLDLFSPLTFDQPCPIPHLLQI